MEHDACSFRIGTTTGGADIVENTLIPPGRHSGTFITPPSTNSAGTVSINLTFENNQFNTFSRVVSTIIRFATINGFQTQLLVGDYIRTNDGYIRYLETLSTQRGIGVITTPLDDTQDALSGAWVIERSQWQAGRFPEKVAFYQGRLVFTGGLKIWGSRVLDNTSFAFGTGDTDAYEFTPSATQVNPPHWILGESTLLIGTRSEEYVVRGTDTDFISPSSINVSSPTAVGSEPVKPIRVNQAALIVKGGGRRIVEFNFNAERERLSRDLSVLASHLIERGDGINSIAWQEEPHQTLWCTTNNGKLYSLAYVREQDIWGWGRHDSKDGALFKYVAVIPHPDGDRDQVWLAVRRPALSQDLIEFMDDSGGLISSNPALTGDGGVRYSGTATTLISGLSHLTLSDDVWVVDAQGAQGPFSVSSEGRVSFSRAVSEADVVVNFEPELTTLRPSLEGGSPTGLKLGNTNLFGSFVKTGEGVEANGKILKLRKPEDIMDGRITPFTGDVELPSVGFSRLETVTIKQTVPDTFNLLSIAGTVKVEDI